jgi:glycerol-3-phosphate acyltransferase PlsY
MLSISLILICYLLGSIPTAVWTSKLVYGFDIRSQGSGNAGATNTFRVLGKKAGIFVLLFDIMKGVAGTSLAFLPDQVWQAGSVQGMLLLGLATVLGHIYPVFAGFKGGKGVATLLGMVLNIHPAAALICVAVFLVVFVLFHYVSAGSMVSALVFGSLLMTGFCGPADAATRGLALLLVALVLFTHRSNIRKLSEGRENKMYLWKRKTA